MSRKACDFDKYQIVNSSAFLIDFSATHIASFLLNFLKEVVLATIEAFGSQLWFNRLHSGDICNLGSEVS